MKRKSKSLIIPFFISWLSLSSAAWATDLLTEIKDAEAKFQSAYNEKKSIDASNLFTENGIRLLPDGSRIDGRNAIYTMIQSELAQGFNNLRLEVIDVEGKGDTAWAIGRYLLDVPAGDNKMNTLSGNYLVIYERNDNDEWHIRVDTWSQKSISGSSY